VPGPNVDASNLAGYQGETTIAINPTNPQNLVAGSNNLGARGVSLPMYSMNGGASWTKSSVPGSTNDDPTLPDLYASRLTAVPGLAAVEATLAPTGAASSSTGRVEVAPAPVAVVSAAPVAHAGSSGTEAATVLVASVHVSGVSQDALFDAISESDGDGLSAPTAVSDDVVESVASANIGVADETGDTFFVGEGSNVGTGLNLATQGLTENTVPAMDLAFAAVGIAFAFNGFASGRDERPATKVARRRTR
jgi:hypothetical protein